VLSCDAFRQHPDSQVALARTMPRPALHYRLLYLISASIGGPRTQSAGDHSLCLLEAVSRDTDFPAPQVGARQVPQMTRSCRRRRTKPASTCGTCSLRSLTTRACAAASHHGAPVRLAVRSARPEPFSEGV
jgi:hypothetical protein